VLAFELKHQDLRVLPSEYNNGKSQRQCQRQRLDARALIFELKVQYLKILTFMDSNWIPHLKCEHLGTKAFVPSPELRP
jgi:hypothetical protein